MKILHLGWEYPPHHCGGLGIACQSLIEHIHAEGAQVMLALPYNRISDTAYKIIGTKNISVTHIASGLHPYATEQSYHDMHRQYPETFSLYSNDLFSEVNRYADEVSQQLKPESFDMIHAHDWMTYKAAIKLKSLTGKPIIAHIHATEFDRTGNHGINKAVYDIERDGFHDAHKVIAVSNFTKQKLIDHYDVPPEKIHVVHNSVTLYDEPETTDTPCDYAKPMVLFAGRLTIQKGVDHFLHAAHKVAHYVPNAIFVIAGDGDMKAHLMHQAFHLGIAHKVVFTGFLDTKQLRQLYRQADLFVMPSVSEPFGLTALEALQAQTPVLISKQSGVSEVIRHCLQVDFWDTTIMADKIIGVLNHQPLQQSLSPHGFEKIKQLSWRHAAQQCVHIYHDLYNG